MPARRRPRDVSGDPAEPPAPMEVALRYLGSRPRTRYELTQRLRRAAVPEPQIEATLDRLVELGYVDDAAFARWWAEQRDRHAPRGRRMLEAELRQRGVPREVIEAHRAEHDDSERAPEDEGVPGSELERAADALARHLRGRPMPDDAKARQRIGMYLMRRGFDAETVRTTLRDAGTDVEDSD